MVGWAQEDKGSDRSDVPDGLALWFRSFAGENSAPSAALRAALAEAGFRIEEDRSSSPSGSGILFLDVVSGSVLEFLREAARDGLDRILAIAAPRSKIGNGDAWRLLEAGASDFLLWDDRHDPANEAAARFRRWASIDRLVQSPLVQENLVGNSPAWISLLRQVVEVARFTDAPVLIAGETGTGKELVARLIHTLDPRCEKKGDLVVLDCTTIKPELSGSEFFGHERGAFTGAVAEREGAFALSHGGTLFLDEVGELPLTLQAELLRVVQERTYKRIGGNAWRQTEFRLVCATNRDLKAEVAQGRFRRDLYYRLAVCTCKLPPLSQRSGDILLLVRHFLRTLRAEGDPIELNGPVRDYLLQREYPGNVRDLKRLMTGISCRHVGSGPITVGNIPPEERPVGSCEPSDWRDAAFERAIERALALGAGLKEIGRGAEETALRIAIREEDGNLQRAADRLGVSDRALQMRQAARRGRPPADGSGAS